MEIISFVQDSHRSKSSRVLLPKKTTRRNYNKNYKSESSVIFNPLSYRPSTENFTVSRVKNPVNLKTFFYSVGQGISVVQNVRTPQLL